MYPVQVITDQTTLTIVIYLLLAILFFYHIWNFKRLKPVFFHEITLSFFVLSSFIGIFLNYHDPVDSIKLFCFYILPVSLMFSVKQMNIKQLYLLMQIIVLLSFLFAGELIQELIELEPIWYQQKNFDYIYSRFGVEMWQLLGSQRSTGLMEHLHVTALFLSIGIIFLNGLMFHSQKNIILWISNAILWMGLFANASRLIIFSLMAFTIVLYSTLIIQKKIKFEYLIKHISLILFAFFLLYFITFKNTYFWNDIYFQLLPQTIINTFEYITQHLYIHAGVSVPHIQKVGIIPNHEVTSYVIIPSIENFYNLLQNTSWYRICFGYGFGQSSFEYKVLNDDFFILQFFLQTGIIGFTLFITTLGSILITIIHNWQKSYKFNQKIFILLLVTGGLIFMLSVSLLHSSVILKKYIYPFVFLATGITSYSLQRLKKAQIC